MNFAWSIGPAPLVQQVVWKRGFEMSADLFPKDGLPSSEDLDALAAEQRIAEETATARGKAPRLLAPLPRANRIHKKGARGTSKPKDK